MKLIKAASILEPVFFSFSPLILFFPIPLFFRILRRHEEEYILSTKKRAPIVLWAPSVVPSRQINFFLPTPIQG